MWIDCDRRASDFFETIGTKEKTFADMLREHKKWVREMVSLKKRIKNPVNLKTGKPLAESTVNNFIKDVECIRWELKNYQSVIKWLRICGFWRGHKWKSELSPEQELISSMLRFYFWDKKELRELREKHDDLMNGATENWRKIAKAWKYVSDQTEKANEELRVRSAFLESTTNQVKPKKKSRVNDIGLKLINGGKKFEEQPPFAN